MLASTIHTPHVDWFAMSPALTLLGASAVCLLAAVLLPAAQRRWFSAWVTAGAFVGAFVAAALLYDRSPHPEGVIANAIVRDRFGALAAIIVCGAGLASVGVSWRMRLRAHTAEYYALLAAAAGGMCFLVTATNLITLFLSLEWFSICLYVLCAIDVELEGSLEAGLKYLVVGGFGSAFLLFGSALVYGSTGKVGFAQIAHATASQGLRHDSLLVAGLAMILAGLGFKASAAPFHMWTPDVYEGAPTPVTGFMAAATKTTALVLTLRLLTTAFPQEKQLWTIALAVIACASPAYDRGWIWLVIVGATATAVSLYYYFGLVRAIYMRAPTGLGVAPAGGQPPRELALQTAVLGCLAVTVASFFAVEPLIKLARMAASSLAF